MSVNTLSVPLLNALREYQGERQREEHLDYVDLFELLDDVVAEVLHHDPTGYRSERSGPFLLLSGNDAMQYQEIHKTLEEASR